MRRGNTSTSGSSFAISAWLNSGGIEFADLHGKLRQLTFVFSESEKAMTMLSLSKGALYRALSSFYLDKKTLKNFTPEDYNLSAAIWDNFCHFAEIYIKEIEQFNQKKTDIENMINLIQAEIDDRNFKTFQASIENAHTRIKAEL